MESIIPALITGVLALLGVIITNVSSNKTMEHKLEMSQAVTNTKLENLTDEVRKHNAVIETFPKLEIRIDKLEERVKVLDDIDHRLTKLESI